MQVAVDWAKGDNYTVFVFYIKESDGKTTVCNSITLSNGETELLRKAFRASESSEWVVLVKEARSKMCPGMSGGDIDDVIELLDEASTKVQK